MQDRLACYQAELSKTYWRCMDDPNRETLEKALERRCLRILGYIVDRLCGQVRGKVPR